MSLCEFQSCQTQVYSDSSAANSSETQRHVNRCALNRAVTTRTLQSKLSNQTYSFRLSLMLSFAWLDGCELIPLAQWMQWCGRDRHPRRVSARLLIVLQTAWNRHFLRLFDRLSVSSSERVWQGGAYQQGYVGKMDMTVCHWAIMFVRVKLRECVFQQAIRTVILIVISLLPFLSLCFSV